MLGVNIMVMLVISPELGLYQVSYCDSNGYSEKLLFNANAAISWREQVNF
jgi:hypothetical protein